MTRDEVLVTINEVFGVEVTAVVGYWNVSLRTIPRREIIFTADWVRAHVDDQIGSVVDMEMRLRSIKDDDWLIDPKSDVLTYIFR